MKLYLIRHGETPWNKKGLIQGQVNIPLNEYGRYLADETCKGLKEIPFTMCITSPLGRAKETAERILKGRDIPMKMDWRLMEMGFGLGEAEPIYKEDGTPTDYMHNFFFDTEKFVPKDGGETFSDMLERAKDFLDDVLYNEAYKDETILVTSHGCTISALLCNVRGGTVADIWGNQVPRNCGVAEVELVDGEAKILSEDVIYYETEKQPFLVK